MSWDIPIVHPDQTAIEVDEPQGLGHCGWCTEPAVAEFVLEKGHGTKRDKTAPVCVAHLAKFSPVDEQWTAPRTVF